MFDVGFSEIFVIAIVALVVIGPERLPTVARTIGTLLGRLNRYVADVKSDVEREMRLEEMKKLRAEVEQQAMGIEQSVVQELESARNAVEQPAVEMQASLSEVMQETGQLGVAIQQSVAETTSAASSPTAAIESPTLAQETAESPAGDSPPSPHRDSLQSPHRDSLQSPHRDSLQSPHRDSLQSQKNDENATLAAPGSPAATRQAALDFDPLNDPAPMIPAASPPTVSGAQPAAKA